VESCKKDPTQKCLKIAERTGYIFMFSLAAAAVVQLFEYSNSIEITH
jgi:hypothetical protein